MENKIMHNNESFYTHQTSFWKAEYHDPLLDSYRGNPLIETLPPAYDRNQVYKLLQYDPGYDESRRQWPDHLRLHLLLEAARFFQPLNIHFELEQRFSRLIRAGYVGRNPLDLGFWDEIERRLRIIEPEMVFRSVPRVPTQGFTLMGISGTGKSRTIDSILPLCPQVIQHHEYQGKRFTWTQLVYFKLECPYDGSITGLCHDFFQQVDQLLGTNYYENYGLRGKPTVDKMRVAMARIASDHSLGVLIIDEIQNLRHARSAGSDKMLSFLVQLDNTIGVPIVFVGTPKARAALAGEFRRARRAAGQGDMPWERIMKEKNKDKEKVSEWRVFLETLWKYEYVHEHTEPTDELSELMYDESQGIADIAIKLYFLAQMRAIQHKTECVTVNTIKKTAQERLGSVQEFLFALRTGNKRLLLKYEDIQPIDLEGAVLQVIRDRDASSSKSSSLISDDTASGGQSVDQEKVAVEAMQGNQNPQHSEKGDKKKGKKPPTKAEGGLLEMAAKGQKCGLTAYDALKKEGFIRSCSEYFTEEIEA